MKKELYIGLLMLSFSCTAQMYDNVWLIGYHYGGSSPIPLLDFTYGYPDTAGVYAPFDMFETDAGICDSNGLLQFYTNGVFVANKYSQLLDNSNDFNYDQIMNMGVSYYMPYHQCAIILPEPENPDHYYIFHLSGKVFNGNQVQPFRLAYSTVDMTANTGAGTMVLKNQEVFADTLLYATLQAVKHANGRDWWIVVHEYGTNGMYAVLLTSNSIGSVVHSNSGPLISSGIYTGESIFSPDGSKYAIASRDSNLLYIYLFDRCSGEFTFDTLIRHNYDPQGYNFAGCCFSPNSRFLYANDHLHLYQYDTDAADVISSEKVIAGFDGYNDPFPTWFYTMQNGPDGKIYMNTWGSANHMHVINNPDMPDTACNFVQHQLQIMNYSGGLPAFPNYRLGALAGPCDSLFNFTSQYDSHSINGVAYPNPSNGIFSFAIAGEKIFEIVIQNSIGERIISVETNTSYIDLSDYKSGVYFFRVKTISGKLFRGKLVLYSEK